MSVIIRLQNLPWSANAVDIRGFFRGLSIPDGGVHIVGGEMGDAFIAFSTDEDARQAMLLDRGKINEVQVRLLLSSRTEMQKVIETARQSSKSIMQAQQEKSPQRKFIEEKPPQMGQLQRPPPHQLLQGQPLQAPQPPIITPSTLKNILSQPVQQHNFTMKDNPIISYQPFSQYNENATDSRNSRDSIKLDDHRGNSPFQRNRREGGGGRDRDRERYQSSRSRSSSRDRRRSISRDYGGNRRRRDRSISDSPDRRDRRRRSRSRDRSRDRNRNDSRRRDREERDFRSRDQQNQSNDQRFVAQKKDVRNPEKVCKSSAMDIDQNLNKEMYSPTQNTFSNDRNNFPRSGNLFSPSHSMSFGMNQSYQSNMVKPTNFSGIEKKIQAQSGQQQNAFQSVRESPFSPKNDFEKFASQIQQSADNSSETSQNDSNKTQIVQNKSNDSLNFQNYFNANLMGNLNYFGSNAKSTPFQNPYTVASNQSNEGSMATPTKTATTTTIDEKQDDVKMNVFGMFENKSIKEAAPIRKPSDDIITPPNVEKDSGLESDSILSDIKKTPMDTSEINYDEIKGNCIKVTNMCPSTSYSDIRRFFSGLYIATNGIKMINDKHGLRIGIAYIRFVRNESKPKAFTRNGLNLKSKRVVVESCTEDEFEEAVDSFKPVRKMHHFDNNKQDMNSSKNQDDEFDERKSSQKMNSEREPPCTTLVLEDVPLFASEQDIMRMFSSYSLVDIVLEKDEDAGRKKFVGFVKFHRPEDVKNALNDKSKHLIGHKRIFVSKCTEESFQKVKQKQETLEIDRKDTLEEESTHEEKEHFNPFMQELGKSSDKIDMKDTPSDDDKFPTPFSKIFHESNSSTDDKPPIPSLFSIRPMPIDPRRRGPDNISNNLETRFVLIRNCDYRCKKQNFADLFLESRLVPFRIEILINSRNQPSGECIIEFRTCEDAKKALLKNNSMCGTRNIRMELIPHSVVAERLGEDFLKQKPPLNDFPANNPSPFNPENNSSGRDFRFEMANQLLNMIRPPFLNNSNMSSDNNSNNNGPNMFRSGGNMNHNNNNNGIRNRMDDDRTMGRRGRKSRFSDYNDNGKRFMGNNMNPGNNSSPTNMPSFPKPNNMPQLNNASVDQFGKPGCVVCLENVPYKAGIDHIIEFFHKFNVQPHNVIRRYNDDGTPTGDARVAFNSPVEARAAIENKKHQKIFNRDIYLSLV